MPCSHGTALMMRANSGARSGWPPGFSATLMMLPLGDSISANA
jgi:hypothetical protein